MNTRALTNANQDQTEAVLIKIPSPQNILIFYNPISSAGNTEQTAKQLEAVLQAHGKNVQV